VWNLFSFVPINLANYQTKKLKDRVNFILLHEKIDVIHIDHLHMGWVVTEIKKKSSAPVVLRQHNLEMNIMKRFYERERNWVKKVYAWVQYKKFRYYEPALCEKFDAVAMISGEDERQLKQLNPKINTVVIPGGMDSDLLNRKVNQTPQLRIVHIGAMDWFPNQDSVDGFISDILPHLVKVFPEIELTVLGKGTEQIQIPATLKKNIRLLGFVDQIWNELETALCVVVPLRIGGGIRVKILEMMAGGIPVVSSSVGAEGIHAVDGKTFLLANTVSEWVNAIKLLNGNPGFRSEMIVEARSFIRENHTWEHVGYQFESLYSSLIQNRRDT